MFIRIISLLTTLFASLILFHPKDGALQLLLWGPKLFASALAPLLVILGGVFAALGFKRRDWLLAGVGFWGAAVAGKHIFDVTASREAAFAEAFGPDWPAGIPASLNSRLRPSRWRPYYRRRP